MTVRRVICDMAGRTTPLNPAQNFPTPYMGMCYKFLRLNYCVCQTGVSIRLIVFAPFSICQ
jgi:hypothetical protein